MKNMVVVVFLFVAAVLGSVGTASAKLCEDAHLLGSALITNVCWDCMFPLKIAGITLAPGQRDNPPKAADKHVCACSNNGLPEPGVPTSMWEPARLIEFPRKAGCSPTLGGADFGFDSGDVGGDNEDSNHKSFFQYHYFSFPLFIIMQLYTPTSCEDGYKDIDLMYFSEIDPTWNDDTLAFFTTPESALVANPIAQSACPADAVAATGGWPIDSLFWCAGSWGSIYPFSGNQNGMAGPLRETSLLATRVLASLHRKGFARRTMGNDAMCKPLIDPMIPKSQYKFTLMYPRPETSSAHVIGENVARWGLGRLIPGVADTPIYLLWRLNDCCNTL